MDNSTQLLVTGVPQNVVEAVGCYQNTYRHPSLRPFEVSGLYDLRPENPTAVVALYRWSNNDNWPNHDRAGVYLIWDDVMNLRYIGRAKLLGKRLHDYFRPVAGKGSACLIRHPGWKSPPRFIATIPVEKSFEAGALEEYLIGALGPGENDLPWCAEWAQRRDT